MSDADEFDADGLSWRDIGHGVEITFYADDAGVIERHACTDGRTLGSVLFAKPGSVIDAGQEQWTVEQRDPLTLSPSILCRACGLHGYIRSGRWVPA